MILPVALLLVLALTALAMSMMVLAHNELLLDRGGMTYLENRIRDETVLEAGVSSDTAAVERPLPGGFVLVVPAGAGPGPAAVRWRPDPDSIARGLPGAAEVGDGTADLPQGSVGPLAGCTPAAGYPLVRTRLEPGGPDPDPRLPDPPRIGVLDVGRLVDMPGVVLDGFFPQGSGMELLRAPDGGRIEVGEGAGVLVSEGSLELTGTASFAGLVLLRGDLVLGDSARVEGVVLAGGGLRVEGEARLLGCPPLAARALVEVLPEGSHPVHAGELLGRF